MGCSSSKTTHTPSPDTNVDTTAFKPIVPPDAAAHAGLEVRAVATQQRQQRLDDELARLAAERVARPLTWEQAQVALDNRIAAARAAGAEKRAAAAAATDAESADDAAMRARLAKRTEREARHTAIATAEGISVNDLPYDEVEDALVEGGFNRAAPALRGEKQRLSVETRALAAFVDGNARPFVLRRAVLVSAEGAADVEALEETTTAALRDTLNRTTFYDANADDFSLGNDSAWGPAWPADMVATDAASPAWCADASAACASWPAAALRGGAEFDEAPVYDAVVDSFTMKSKGALRPIAAAPTTGAEVGAAVAPVFAAWGPGLAAHAVARDTVHKSQLATIANREARAAKGCFPLSAAAAGARLTRCSLQKRDAAALAAFSAAGDTLATIKVLSAEDMPAIMARHAAAEAAAFAAREAEGSLLTSFPTAGKFAKLAIVTKPALAKPTAVAATVDAVDAVAAPTTPVAATPAKKKHRGHGAPRSPSDARTVSPKAKKPFSPAKLWDFETTASKGRFDMQSLEPFAWRSDDEPAEVIVAVAAK